MSSNPLLDHLSGIPGIAEEDFISFGEQISYADLVIIVDPIFNSIDNLLQAANQLNQIDAQIMAPVRAELGFLNAIASIHRETFADLFADKEPTDSQEAYLRGLYKMPERLLKVIAHVRRLMQQLNKPDSDD